MTPERYHELETDPKAKLTKEECKEGWHYCSDWDGMLVGPDGEDCIHKEIRRRGTFTLKNTRFNL